MAPSAASGSAVSRVRFHARTEMPPRDVAGHPEPHAAACAKHGHFLISLISRHGASSRLLGVRCPAHPQLGNQYPPGYQIPAIS